MSKSFNQFDIVSQLRNIDFLVGYKGDNGEEIRINGATLAGIFAGQSGSSVQIQYSANTENWHYPAMEGDQYIKFKAGNDAWSQAFKIVAVTENNGKEVELQVDEDMLQWRYVGDAEWVDLYDLSELNGDDGLSAYETWIAQGNSGSEEDFLNSLKGIDGERGIGIYKYLYDIGTGFSISNYTGAVPTGVKLKVNDLLLGADNKIGRVTAIIHSDPTYAATHPYWMACEFILDIKGATGDSAYAIWLAQGNSGTEEDFLNSLKGTDGKNIELQTTSTHIQWRIADGTWVNLVALSALKGTDGKNIELQTTSTHIQWRVVGSSTWTDLVALSSLGGGSVSLTGGNYGDILWTDANGDPQWLRGLITADVTESQLFELTEYARKIIIEIHHSLDFCIYFIEGAFQNQLLDILEEIHIVVYNNSDTTKIVTVDGNPIIWKENINSFNMMEYSMMEISLLPIMTSQGMQIIGIART